MSRFSYKTLFTILFLLLGSIVLLLRLQYRPTKVSAGWWDDSWNYRQAITVTISSGTSDVADLDTVLSIGTSSLVASGKLQSDCDDLRFTNITGTVLPYYIDSGCNSSATKIWVRADLVPKNTTTYSLYVYYGNPSATAGSSSTTFNLYNGLVAYWNFNENTGTSAADLSVNTNTATFGSGSSAPNWTTGNYGTGISLDGNDYLLRADTSSLDIATSITISAWIKPGSLPGYNTVIAKRDASATEANYALRTGTGGSSDELEFYYANSGWHVYTTSNANLSTGNWYFVTATYDGTTVRIYKNGTLLSGTCAYGLCNTSLVTDNNDLAIGRGGEYPEHFIGLIDDVRIYNRTLPATEISQLYSNPGTITTATSTVSEPSTSFASEETGTAPVAYWKFDEGVGTTAYDSSSSNHGTLASGSSSPTWQTEDMCISNKCLKFDGNDYASVAATNLTNWTVSLWAKSTSLPAVAGFFITKNNYAMDGSILSDGTIRLQTQGGANFIDSTNKITDKNWHHYTFKYDGTTIFIYIDGSLNNSANKSAVTGSGAINIGRRQTDSNYYFTGFLDDIKIYPYARTATQIKQDYLAGKSKAGAAEGVAVALGGQNQAGAGGLSDGLIAWWNFDNGAGTTAADLSGNSNTANIGSGTTAAGWTTGKYGIGLSFDGSDDYTQVSYSTSLNPTSAISISAWVKTSSTDAYDALVFRLDSNSPYSGYVLGLKGGSPLFHVGGLYASNELVGTTSVSNNNWRHLVGTFDGATAKIYVDGTLNTSGARTNNLNNTSTTLWIGREFWNGYFTTLTDDVRIYNRALTPNEVKQLYEWAPGPIAYYNFEEGTGTTAFDTSGNSNNGALGTGNSAPIWTAGKFGKALNFDGSNDYINLSSVTGPTALNGSISAWVKESTWNTSLDEYIAGHSIYYNANALYLSVHYNDSVGSHFRYGNTYLNYTGSNNFANNSWHHLAATWNYNGSNVSLAFYVDGILTDSDTSASTISFTSSKWRIGYFTDTAGDANSTYLSGLIDDVRLYNYARTAKQIIEDMNAGHPAVSASGKNTVAYYKFDEGYGSTTANWSNIGSTLNGTLGSGTSSPTWTTNGKFGKALSFDGNDGVSLGDSSSLQPNNISVSAWFKTSASGEQRIVRKRYYGYNLGQDENNKIRFFLYTSTGSSNPAISTNSYNDNSWHHALGTYDGSTVKLFVDSKLVGSTLATTTGNIYYTADAVTIGRDGTYTQNFFNGLIDEVKIYNYALTEDEVKLEYNRGSSSVMGSLSSGSGNTAPNNAASQEYCVPGSSDPCSPPVAEWKFEEGVGTTAYDNSGNSNHGVFGSGSSAPSWTNGKVGKGLSFDGIDNYINTNLNISSLSQGFTIEGWGFHTDTSGWRWIIGEDTSNYFFVGRSNNGNYMHIGFQGILNAVDITNAAIPKNQWTFYTVNWDGTTNANGIKIYINGVLKDQKTASSTTLTGTQKISIGKRRIGEHMQGKIDQVRIYNYARTPAQIAWDYNRGAPIAHYKFDECQGSIAHSSSEPYNSALDGTITIGAGGSQVSLGTCAVGDTSAWSNGITGKINSAMSFDGNDDYVNIGTGVTANSLSFWVKPTSNTASIMQLATGIGVTASSGIITAPGFTSPTIYVNAVPNTTLTANTWQMITVTSSTPVNASAIKLAVYGSSYLSGLLDDVRIYNYALTSEQVKTIYNGGSVNFQ